MKQRKVVGKNAALIGFLYELMRDYVPPGIVEKVVRSSPTNLDYLLCNGYLADYAADVVGRLTKRCRRRGRH